MEPLSPYPGLRSFDVDESHLFFGREEQTDELLLRLHATRFLAIVGPSGCGKSSLVRAGMIASLSAGFMVAAGSRWQFAIMRPESRPMHALAQALVEQTTIGADEADQEIATGLLDATLRRGPLGVVEALRDTPLAAGTNLLILVDQFEEIFRFEREGGGDEADAFVSLLLATARQREVPVYVVITMRSDFFGDCAIFEGLPEALNQSQYLTPRLTRQQRQAAIEGPAQVFDGEVAPDLVNRLLNQMGTDPDQLPLMQHLLMRMWTWRDTPRLNAGGEPETVQGESEADGTGRKLTLVDCDAVGGLEHALSRHADEAYESLDDRQKAIAETLFRILSERAPGNRDIRRPTGAGELAELAGVSLDELVAVVEAFRAPGRSFIVPAYPQPIRAERVLDITHESLIRQWDRLKDWAEQEEQAADTYRSLAKSASLWQRGQSALWQSPDLERGLAWREGQQPTALWAKRYGGDFTLAMTFLAESEQAKAAREAESVARRKAQLRHLTLGFASATAVALVLAGYFAYYFYAYIGEDVHYYKSFVKRFGEPVGVGELSLDQTHHRAVSLKLVRQGFRNPVVAVEAVNADGKCAPANSVDTYLQPRQEASKNSPLHECRWQFIHDDKQQVIYEKAYDKEGQFRWSYTTPPSEDQTKSRMGYYLDRDGLPGQSLHSTADIVRFIYSPRGYEIRETWMDRARHPQPGKDRAFGREIEYDEQGRLIRMSSLDEKGRLMNDTAGNATQIISYDQFGNETDFKALDKDGKPVMLKDGYYEDRSTFDENGNSTSDAFFGPAGHPALNEDKAHMVKYDYDQKGNIKQIRYYDTKDKPGLSKDGYHKEVILARDGNGNLLRWAYFGVTGKPATDADGVHEYWRTYDPRGFLQSEANFDRDGRPTTGKEGVHRVEWHYDASGNKVSEAYFDRDGKPTRDVDGWFHIKITHDDRGNVIKLVNFDSEGRPTITYAGYHSKEMKYDAHGFRTEVAYFGEQGSPMSIQNGGFGKVKQLYHKIITTYDLRGNQTSISYWDTNNKPAMGTEGYARIKNKYDRRDHIVEWTYYGADGRLTNRGKGYAIERRKYDDRDRMTEQAYYNGDGRLTKGPDGYAVMRRQYDGDREDDRYIDAGKQPVAVNGCMTIRSILDQRTGKQTETDCLDAQGQPTQAAIGAAIIRMKYDAHGNEVEEAYFGTDGKALRGSGGYALWRKKYDDHGNEVEVSYFGTDQKLQLIPAGYAILRKKYDDHGNELREEYFGENGQYRLGPDGYAMLQSKYDDHGNQIEVDYFGQDGKPSINKKEGYASARGKYDDDGNITEFAVFGTDGKLRAGPEGYAMFHITYDRHGQKTQISFFGEDGKPRVNPKQGYGYATVRNKYDDHGNRIEVEYLGEDGKLLAQSPGYAIIRYKYDDRGNKLEEAYFGEDGKPQQPYGYAIERTQYDGQGSEIKLADFAAGGAPTSAARGFATAARVTEIVVRDEAQRVQAQCLNRDVDDFWNSPKGCTDADGKPVAAHPVIIEVLPHSRAQALGLQTGDVFESYDGKPVSTIGQMLGLIEAPGDKQRRIELMRQGHPLAIEAPPGKLGMRLGITFVAAAAQSPSADNAGR